MQPLEGFESSPIADSLRATTIWWCWIIRISAKRSGRCACGPSKTMFGERRRRKSAGRLIGPCLESYRYAGKTLGLAARRRGAGHGLSRRICIDDPPPATWAEVEVACARRGPSRCRWPVRTPFSAFCRSRRLSASRRRRAIRRCLSARTVGCRGLRYAARLVDCNAAPAAAELESDRHPRAYGDAEMTSRLCPLIYRLCQLRQARRRTSCHQLLPDAPASARGGIPGSTLGGTGIGISTRCEVTARACRPSALADRRRGAMRLHSAATKDSPAGGRPGIDGAVNADAGGFYKATAMTLEHAYVRPALRRLHRFRRRKRREFLRTALAGGFAPQAIVNREPQFHCTGTGIGDQTAMTEEHPLRASTAMSAIITINRPKSSTR